MSLDQELRELLMFLTQCSLSALSSASAVAAPLARGAPPTESMSCAGWVVRWVVGGWVVVVGGWVLGGEVVGGWWEVVVGV
jgi:hypothetical protein